MIITREWLQEWIDIENISTDELTKELSSIGLEVDSVKKIRMPKGIVVGYIVSCEKHPNADKLNICKVDLGDKIEQIICGATNVADGQMVAIARIGSVLPSGLKIKEAKLRDVFSYGMICSSTELGLPKINDGIMILDESIGKLEIGKQLSDFPLLNGDVIELELTANRGDCLSIHGVARDISVPFGLDVRTLEVEEEDGKQLGIGRVLNVTSGDKIESSFIFKALENKQIKSNLLIDLRLSLVGESEEDELQKLIIYSTYSTGVLLRAYDYEAFDHKDGKAILRAKKQSNNLDAVLGKKRISYVGISQEPQACANKSNEKIILEANYSHPNIISENSFNKKIDSDRHLYRSSRGSEPDLDFGMNHLINILKINCDVMVYAGSQHIIQDFEEVVINLHIDEITNMVGQEISKNQLINILQKLGFEVVFKHEQEAMNIRVPAFRHDVLNKQDICEEIVRIVGIDNIDSKPLIFAQEAKHNNSYVNFKKRQSYRFKSAANGFFESMHFIFDDRAREEKYGLETIFKNIDLSNPITSELNSLRTSLIPNMLDSVNKNVKYGKKTVPLFEIGTVFNKQREESIKMAFVFSGEKSFAQISNHGKPEMIDFYYFARAVSNIIGVFDLEVEVPKIKLCNPYEYALIKKDEITLGYISRLHAGVEKDFDLNKTYICELDFDKLPHDRTIVKSYSNYQAISRDLSLLISREMPYFKIKEFIKSIAPKELVQFNAIDLYESKDLGEKLSLTIKFHFQSGDKTLTDEETSSMMENILNSLKEEFGIDIR